MSDLINNPYFIAGQIQGVASILEGNPELSARAADVLCKIAERLIEAENTKPKWASQ